jgi:hypothetical protein
MGKKRVNRKTNSKSRDKTNKKEDEEEEEQNRADFWWKASEEEPAPGRREQKCCGGDAGARDPVQQSSTGSVGEEGESHPLLAFRV